MNDRSWKPTKKWVGALAGAVASVAASWLVTGAFDDVERGMVGTAVVALAAAYFRENEATASGDGVPTK
jgi:urea transporter